MLNGKLKFLRLAPLSEPIRSRDSTAILMWTLRNSAFDIKDDFTTGAKAWRVFAYIYNMVVLPLSFPINYWVYLSEFSADQLLQSLQLCLNTWGFAFKVLTLVLRHRLLEVACKKLDDLDVYCVTNEEKLKLRATVASNNRLYVLFAVTYFIYTVTSLVDGLLHERVPFNTYVPFINWREDRLQLYLQCTLEFWIVGYSIYVSSGTDAFPVIFVSSLRTHVELLKKRVVRLGVICGDPEVDPETAFKKLVECIKAHRTMLQFCEALKPVVSGVIFAQFITCGTILGVIMINVVTFSGESSRVHIGIYIFAVLMQTFPLCYYCNAIVDDNREVADALFHSSWWNQDKRYQRVVLQYLQKLQGPMTFTAMQIFNINLATNINVAKFAFTVYALASGMNLEERLQWN
ncbi:hypothetical protein KR018_010449 [Drosophila ironensis]|nr:hypothetical protein KR018_010449 [Drosophila ironensis]